MPRKSKWKTEWYVEAYVLAKDGLTDDEIAESFGVPSGTFSRWTKEKPALRKALTKARKKNKETFSDYVYGALPPELKKIWDTLMQFNVKDPSTPYEVRKMLRQEPKKHRQSLFIYAFIHSKFSMSKAAKRMGMNVGNVDKWIREDPEFSKLLSGVHLLKKDFFETQFIKLAQKGDASAILFGNRTLNRDRGYSEKVEIDVKHNHTHKVQVEDLGLSLNTKKEILQAMRLRSEKQLQLPAPITPVIDAEFTTAVSKNTTKQQEKKNDQGL